MRKTLIFDLDGTLLDTLYDLFNAVNFAMLRCDYPPRTLEEVRTFVGNGVRNLIKRAMPSGCSREDFDICFAFFKEYYEEHTFDFTKPYDGIISLLKRLKNEGYSLAIVSNKADFAVKKLSKHFFERLIDVSLGAREGISLKPEPDMINIVLSELDKKRTDAIYIGDSDVDIMTAYNVNIPCINVLWGFREEKFLLSKGAKLLASDTDDLYDMVHNIK